MLKLGLVGIALAVTVGCKAGPTIGAHRRRKAPDPPAAATQAAARAATPPAPSRTPPRAVIPPSARATGESWNATQIDWVDYDQGLARAKVQHKPVCLVFFATWCPHCKNYSHVFEDPRVVSEAKKFVMIRIDVDRHPDLSQRYSLDGSYVPRTYFLSPTGNIAQNVRGPRDRFQYFYDEHNPASVLGGMHQAEKLID